jgi:hypothetical protein
MRDMRHTTGRGEWPSGLERHLFSSYFCFFVTHQPTIRNHIYIAKHSIGHKISNRFLLRKVAGRGVWLVLVVRNANAPSEQATTAELKKCTKKSVCHHSYGIFATFRNKTLKPDFAQRRHVWDRFNPLFIWIAAIRRVNFIRSQPFQITPQLCFAVIIHRHSLESLLDAINLFASHHMVHYCNVPGQAASEFWRALCKETKLDPTFQNIIT